MRRALLALLLACGGSAPPTETPAVRVEGWPAIPFNPSGLGLRALIDMHDTLRPLPAATGPAWAREVHGPWVDERAETLAHANEARRWLRRGGSRELAIGAAIHGDIMATTAAQLEDVNLSALPPGAAVAVRAPVAEMKQKAFEAWGVCIELATGPELDGWRRACETRRGTLGITSPADTSPRSPPPDPPRDTTPSD